VCGFLSLLVFNVRDGGQNVYTATGGQSLSDVGFARTEWNEDVLISHGAVALRRKYNTCFDF
jgi:hypothetical protein